MAEVSTARFQALLLFISFQSFIGFEVDFVVIF